MKLKKREGEYIGNKLHYRYFEDEKINQEGYHECISYIGKTLNKRYWFNGKEIGFELWGIGKYYNI